MYACLRSEGTSDAIVAIARNFSPRIERHGTACIVLDVSGLGCLLGDAHAIGGELARAAIARGGGIRVGVAPTQTAAMLLTIARPGLTVAIGDPGASLGGLPIAALRHLLASRGSRASLDRPEGKPKPEGKSKFEDESTLFDVVARWGLRTLGEVAALPSADLSERLGQKGLVLQRLARGQDAAPLVPDPDVPRFVQSIALEWPIEALEPLSFVLARLVDPLAAALERADRGAAAIRLDLRLVDRTTHARVVPLPAAMRDGRVLRTLLLLDLESHPPAAAIDGVSIEVDPAPSRIVQYSLLERAMPSPETLATLTARLGALVGDGRCGSPALVDTYRPDGFEMRRFAPVSDRVAPVGPTFGSGELELSDERFAHARPEGRAYGSTDSRLPVLRRFRPAIAVRVAVERGRPVHVAVDRRGMPGGRVEQFAGPWRTSGAWWDADGAQWDRDEWDLALSDGAIGRVFRDRLTGRWFLEGVLD